MANPIGADDADTKVFTTLVCFLTWDTTVAANSPTALATATLGTSEKNRTATIYYPIEKRKKTKYANAQSKSLAALPCKPRFAAKHLLSTHRTCSVDSSVQLDKI